MDIHKLIVFLAVVDLGSINKAAEKSGYSQAGVSYIVQSVEKYIGFTLLERSTSGVKLTENGLLLIEEIRKLVNTASRLEGLITGLKNQQNNAIHIATYDSISIKWLPKALSRFRQIRPSVYVNIVAGSPQLINDLLDDGSADIGLLEQQRASSRHDWQKLVEDQFYGVFPKGSNLQGSCSFADFEGRKFYFPDYMRDPNVANLLRDNNVNVDILHDKTSICSTIQNIAEGYGCSIISALSINLCNLDWQNTTTIPDIAPLTPFCCRELGAAIRKNKKDDDDIKAFIKCLKAVMRESCTKSAERNDYIVDMR